MSLFRLCPLPRESKLPTSVDAICHWHVMSPSCKSSPGILVMMINLDIMKAGYGESFVLACVASGLFSEMEKKEAAKRREVVPLPFHWAVVCHASLRDRCPTSRPSHNPKRKASYARLFSFHLHRPAHCTSLHRIKSKMASAMVSRRLLLLKASISNKTIDKRFEITDWYLWSQPFRIDSRLLIFCKAAEGSEVFDPFADASFLNLRC